MKIYGYARVSAKDQNLDRQINQLDHYIGNKGLVLTDKQSGKNFDRPQYQLLKNVADKGDVIYIKNLDRLGRNKKQIKEELEYFKNKGVRIKILDLPTTMIDIPEGQEWIMDMINNLLLEVLSTIAQQERITIKTRQAEGIAIAKKKGVRFGRPAIKYPEQWLKVYNEWKTGKIKAVEAMKKLDLTKPTFYRLVKKYECN
ncbi:recombinase family protein [Clostridium sp. BJN0013]|uniref:recombinase family protein n=1 Tax=Clostridium sp. BJN0013 TaxID=3236840 RepID=UPI0034C6A192